MKRKVIAIMMTAALALGLAACGGSAGSTSAGSSAASAAGSEAATEEVVSASSSGAEEASAESAQDTSSASTDEASSAGAENAGGEIRSTGPKGETAVNAEEIQISDEQIAQIKEGGYKAAICLHYGGNDWSTSQQQGLKDTFGDMGIEIVAVTDANFSAEQQVSDIETVMAKNPDIIISIPTDVTATADAYKRAAAAGIKLVFMDNCPAEMTAGTDYVSVVSADNYGNGYESAMVMGEALGGEGEIAMVYYDADFFVTNQRDQGFRDGIAENFPNITIKEEVGFTDENGCSEQGDAILTKYPDIDGIYATWDVPMEGVLSSVRAANKEGQIVLTTNDLGNNMAKEVASGVVAGLGAQMPYDQGVAEAKLAALALLGEETPAYVAVPAKKVTADNVLESYNDVYHVEAPDWLKEAVGA